MRRPRLTGLTPGRLRLWLGLFFTALAVPSGLLVYHAWGQLKWEAFHQQRVLAEEFAGRADARLAVLIAAEEARAVTDYAFLVVAGDPAAHYVQRSPLAAFPPAEALPGLVGHFQVDADGAFSSPLLPADADDAIRYGVTAAELAARRARVAALRELLEHGRLEAPAVADSAPRGAARRVPVEALVEAEQGKAAERTAPAASATRLRQESRTDADGAAAAPGQALFDRLESEPVPREEARRSDTQRSLGRVEALQLEPAVRDKSATPRQADAASAAPQATGAAPARQPRKELNVQIAPPPADDMRDSTLQGTSAERGADPAPAAPARPLRTFESDVDPFRFALLDAGHFLLYRKVWQDGRRTIQGALIEREPLLGRLLREPFTATALSRASDLLVAWQGEVLAVFGGRGASSYSGDTAELRGALLHQVRLSAPLSALELVFSVTRLPPGPGAALLGWVSALLAAVLVGGFTLLYRLGIGQLRLARQQQDFVSAVSHELKTPLTSIRMYSEMLCAGWVDETRRRGYYEFIHGESERLSRLIDNVLQLARMKRNGLRVAPRPLAAAALLEQACAKVAVQVERAGFTLEVDCADEAATACVNVDPDHFLQIVINLVDNALKFAAHAERKVIVLGGRLQRNGTLQVSVRDFGPGVPPDQMKKIFRLFYRPGNELTRETVGTGIGLALVQQLAAAMGGTVDVVNRTPGAEFQISFPTVRVGA